MRRIAVERVNSRVAEAVTASGRGVYPSTAPGETATSRGEGGAPRLPAWGCDQGKRTCVVCPSTYHAARQYRGATAGLWRR